MLLLGYTNFRLKNLYVQVNRRLQDQEKDGKDGDPAFPKHQWPSSELCPLCHLPASNVSATFASTSMKRSSIQLLASKL